MKKSTIWLLVFLGSLLAIGIVVVFGAANSGDDDFNQGDSVNAKGASDSVDMEKLAAAYELFLKTESKEISGFELEVNKPKIYHGKKYVKVHMNDQGSVIGYERQSSSDSKPYEFGKDETLFVLDIDKEGKQIVTRDRHDRYYRHSFGSSLLNAYLISSILSRQRSYYGGRYYRTPRNANFMRSGYYRAGRSTRTGSGLRSGSRRTRSSGGFGSGK